MSSRLASPHHSLRHRAEDAAFSGAALLIRSLPDALARALGRALGELWRWVDPRHRRTARSNLAVALPGLPASERARLERRCFREYGAGVLDGLRAASLPASRLEERIDWEGWSHLEEAEAEGRGLILVSAHHGSFEIGAWAIAGRRRPIHLVGRQLKNPLLDARLKTLRQEHGIEHVERRAALRAMLRVLRKAGRAGFALDQRVHPEQAIEARLFGQRTFVSFGPGLLATLSGAPVLAMTAEREGRRYRVRLGEPIVAAREGAAEVLRVTQAALDQLETGVRRRPELWTWQHRTWRAEDEGRRASSSVARELRQTETGVTS